MTFFTFLKETVLFLSKFQNIKKYYLKLQKKSFFEKIFKVYKDLVSFFLEIDLFILQPFSSNFGLIFLASLYIYSVLMFLIDYRLFLQPFCFLIFFYLYSNFLLFSVLLSFSHGQNFLKYFLDEKKVLHFATVITFHRFLILTAMIISVSLLAEWSKNLDTMQDIQKSKELSSKMYEECKDCALSEILEKSEKYYKAHSQILAKKSISIFQKLAIKLYKIIN